MSKHILWKKGDNTVTIGYMPITNSLYLTVVDEDQDGDLNVLVADSFESTALGVKTMMNRALEHCSMTRAIRNSISNHIIEEFTGLTDTTREIDWTDGIPMEGV